MYKKGGFGLFLNPLYLMYEEYLLIRTHAQLCEISRL